MAGKTWQERVVDQIRYRVLRDVRVTLTAEEADLTAGLIRAQVVWMGRHEARALSHVAGLLEAAREGE